MTHFRVRAGQREYEQGVRVHRVSGLLARRQYGKTTIASRIALYAMMKTAGQDVVFGSVKIDLGREIVRKEAAALRQALTVISDQATEANMLMQLTDGQTGKALPDKLSADDFAEIYEATRLEFRLYHSNTIYSRTKVVALTPDAVGETGYLIMDEVGRVKNFDAVLEAVMPIISSNPTFRAIFTTTPPPDDTHPSYGLLAPPIDAVLPVNPTGNWYRSELGIQVLRITAYDAFADGVQLYDNDSGAPITPEESRRRDGNKDAWDRNYGCQFIIGGTSVCGLQELDNAQRKGVGKCFLELVDDDLTFDAALVRLTQLLGEGKVAGGWDLASTEGETSNPSSFTVTEEVGSELVERGVFVWKSSNPAVQIERAVKICHAVEARRAGGKMRRLAIDATGDRLFARSAQTAISIQAGVPVELVVSSVTVEIAGYDSSITMKTYLGDQYVGALNDNRLTLPPERYLKEDHRMPKKIRGLYVCTPDSQGRHGDTFDSGKLSKHALASSGGAITEENLSGIRSGDNGGLNRPQFQPRRIG